MKAVRTETLFLSIALRTMTITSSIASLRSKRLLSRRRFLDVITDAADDILCSIGIPDDTAERFPDFAEIWRTHVQKAHGRTGIVARGGDRMQNFVSQRGGQLSHHAQAIHVREIRSPAGAVSHAPLCARLRSVTSTCVATISSSPSAESKGWPIDSRCLTVPSGRTILNSISYSLLWRSASRTSSAHPVAIVWMNPLQHSFAVGETLPGIKTPDSVTFLGPVDRPCRVKDRWCRCGSASVLRPDKLRCAGAPLPRACAR